MLEEFLVWLLAAYGCSSLLAALLAWLATRAVCAREQPIHYQLLVSNSEQQIEGVVRGLLIASAVRGTAIRISFVDCGSTDDTLQVAAIFRRTRPYLVGDPSDTARHMVTIDLRGA